MHFPGNTITLLFLGLDDTGADKLFLLYCLYLPDNAVYLRTEIRQYRTHCQGQMLGLRQHGLQAPQAQFHLVTL